MARIYQFADGELPVPGQASRLVYMLREIRCAIESETFERLEDRLAVPARTTPRQQTESAVAISRGRVAW
jgi:hypothetical protein